MDNITRAEIDALDAKRGPPDSLFFAGAGEYRSQLLRPSIQRDEKMRQQLLAATARARPSTASGGPAWSGRGLDAMRAGPSADLQDALQIAEATMVQSEPVHCYDLKETAAKKTQELIEREQMVRARSCVRAGASRTTTRRL
jgi:hypothetical protein